MSPDRLDGQIHSPDEVERRVNALIKKTYVNPLELGVVREVAVLTRRAFLEKLESIDVGGVQDDLDISQEDLIQELEKHLSETKPERFSSKKIKGGGRPAYYRQERTEKLVMSLFDDEKHRVTKLTELDNLVRVLVGAQIEKRRGN